MDFLLAETMPVAGLKALVPTDEFNHQLHAAELFLHDHAWDINQIQRRDG